MFGLGRRNVELEFITPPAELPPPCDAQRLAELRSRQDAAVRILDDLLVAPPSDVRDALLDVRHALRPTSVPVIPGRSS